MAALTVRGRALRWWTNHRGLKEDPPGSNRDNRKDGITAAQRRLGAWLIGLAWCGVWLANALLAAGVKGVSWRQASVALCEDDARAGRAPFRDFLAPTLRNARRCLRGDAVILFGRGVHIGGFRALKYVIGVGWCVITEEGNTASGNTGSQSDGGMSTRRVRPLSTVHGFARVDFPGGPARRAPGRARTLTGMLVPTLGPVTFTVEESSDAQLLRALESQDAPERTQEMLALRAELRKVAA
jgi:hypothetical protein